MSTAYISRFRTPGGWRLQLIVGADGGAVSVLTEVHVPDEQDALCLADDFLYDLAGLKDLEITLRPGDDS